MSGYRTLLRERVGEEGVPVWRIKCCSLSKEEDITCHVVASCGDGTIRVYELGRRSSDDMNPWSITCVQSITGKINKQYPELCSSSGMDLLRNYNGQDEWGGHIILGTVRFDGHIMFYTSTEGSENDNSELFVPLPESSWRVEMATGTIFKLVLLQHFVGVWIGTLEHTLELYSTGISTPPHHQTNSTIPPAGTLLHTITAPPNSRGSSIVSSIATCPKTNNMAIGRSNGSFEIYSPNWNRIYTTTTSAKIRALSYTCDGELLLVGNDDGDVIIYDAPSSQVVEQIHQAHSSFIFSIAPCCIQSYSKFTTCSMDQTIKVWDTSKMPSQTGPVHSFTATAGGEDDFPWDMTTLSTTHHNTIRNNSQINHENIILTSTNDATQKNEICISAGNDGTIHVYSCNDK